MSGRQPLKLLRLTRLAVMSAVSSVCSDQGFDHPRDQSHASITSFAIEVLVRGMFLPPLVSLLDIYGEPSDSIPLLYLFCSSKLVRISKL
jgi:hypothetical protein